MRRSLTKSARALACAALFASPGAGPAAAGPDRLSFLLGSYHVGATQSFEEFNPGAFLTWTNLMWRGALDLTVGAYRNSYGDGSLAVTTAYPFVRTEKWGLELFGGLAWYPGNGDQFSYSAGDVVPLAGLQARYRNVFVQAIPSGGSSVDAVLSFGLTFALE